METEQTDKQAMDDVKEEDVELQSSVVNMEKMTNFLNEAKAMEFDLLLATIGPVLCPHMSLWDALHQKMK